MMVRCLRLNRVVEGFKTYMGAQLCMCVTEKPKAYVGELGC